LENRFTEIWEMLHLPAYLLETRSNEPEGSSASNNEDIPLEDEERAKLVN
jgi:hypothetical protein